MLSLNEQEICHTHKCSNANHCWHFNILSMINTTSDKIKARNCFIFRYYSGYYLITSRPGHTRSFLTTSNVEKDVSVINNIQVLL